MSLFDTGLTVRYRRFRAHHEHTYPVTFFMIGVGKFLLEVALLCFVGLSLVVLAMKVSNGDKPAFITSVYQDRSGESQIGESAEVVADVSVATPVVAENASSSRVVEGFVRKELVRKEPDPKGLDPKDLDPKEPLSSSQLAVASVAPATIVNKVADSVTDVAESQVSSRFDPAGEVLLAVSKNTDVADPVATASTDDESLLQKIVIARSKEGVNKDQVAAIFDHEWILSRPRHHFVIQLASSARLDKLLEFSRELGNESKVSIFPFKVSSSNELLYGVSVGEYSTLKQAMLAVKNYPDSARRYSPWVRKLSDVQRDIQSMAGRADLILLPVPN